MNSPMNKPIKSKNRNNIDQWQGAYTKKSYFYKIEGTSLAIQWFRLQASTAGGMVGSITLQAVWHNQKFFLFYK